MATAASLVTGVGVIAGVGVAGVKYAHDKHQELKKNKDSSGKGESFEEEEVSERDEVLDEEDSSETEGDDEITDSSLSEMDKLEVNEKHDGMPDLIKSGE